MKIKSIHLKNLNSLKGEFYIDFSIRPLSDCGLFAITGATGAGKSTILDAITLALYSYTPRLDKITDSVISDKGGIVTMGTSDAFAELVFEINHTTYKSQWAINKNRNQKWNKIQFKLSQFENGVFIPKTDKLSETKLAIIELIGLDERQFNQAIVLSQGKFDEFLKADKNLRYKLLEIITGTAFFRTIGMTAYKKLQEIIKNIEALNMQMGSIQLLSADELEEKTKLLNNILQETASISKVLAELDQQKKTKTDIEKIKEGKKQLESEFEKQALAETAFEAEKKTLDNHSKALPFLKEWNELKQDAASIYQIKNRINQLAERISNSLEEKENTIKKLAESCTKTIKEENLIQELDNFYNNIDTLDRNIQQESVKLKDIRNVLHDYYKLIDETLRNELKPIMEKEEALTQFLKKNNDEIKNLPIPSSIDLSQLTQEIITHRNLIHQLDTVVGYKTQTIEAEEKIEEYKQKKIQVQQEIESTKSTLKEQETKQQMDSAEVDALKKAVEAMKAIVSMESTRASLTKGTPCPCCGSLNHPYATSLPALNNQLEIDYKKKALELDQLNKEIIQTKQQIAVGEKESYFLEQQIQADSESLSKKASLLHDLLKGFQLNTNSSREIIHEKKSELENIVVNLEKLSTWNATEKSLTPYIKTLSDYHKIKNNLDALSLKRKNDFAGESIREFRDDILMRWNTATNNFAQAQLEKEKNEAELKSCTNKHEQALSVFTHTIKHAGFIDLQNFEQCILEEKIANELAQKQLSIEHEKNTLNGSAAQIEKMYAELLTKDDNTISIETIIQSITDKKSMHDALLTQKGTLNQMIEMDRENKKSFAKIQEKLEAEEQRKKIHEILNVYVGDATGNKFNNYVQRITTNHLFAMANMRLDKLMGRYQLLLGSEEMEDEIWVIDTHMGDEQRTIESVSGGERFLISLSLALALSDMASQNVKIDSLFIDEGFGSLSPEELDNAICMLEKMQIENEKTIGIISHVESLKERIITQIQVSKKQNGISTLFLSDQGERQSLERKKVISD